MKTIKITRGGVERGIRKSQFTYRGVRKVIKALKSIKNQ